MTMTVAQKKEIHANINEMIEFAANQQFWSNRVPFTPSALFTKQIKRLERRKTLSAEEGYRLECYRKIVADYEAAVKFAH